MVAAYPYVPLGGNIRVGVAIWSYLGTLHFGVTGDDDAAPDIHRVCAAIDDGIRELLECAWRTPYRTSQESVDGHQTGEPAREGAADGR
jgi:hypothetical protein